MSYYFITFRIADGAADRMSYENRYEALMENIEKARAGGYWSGTTSFIAMESTLDTSALCKTLCEGLSAKDMVVTFDPSDMSMAYFGDVSDPDILGSFFQTTKKVG